MSSDFTKTQYFKYLLDNAATLEKERLQFNSKIIDLLNRQVDELGLILKSHLIIEYYIDEYIITAFPAIIEPEKLRLTFNQKLELINNDKTVFGMAYSAIKSLNTLRNKFSHKLSYKTVDSDYKEIKDLMTIWNNALGEQTPTGLILIQEFSVWICGNLDSMTRGIKRETPELGLSGYLTFLHKMTSV
jgi:hypothetical protein